MLNINLLATIVKVFQQNILLILLLIYTQLSTSLLYVSIRHSWPAFLLDIFKLFSFLYVLLMLQG